MDFDGVHTDDTVTVDSNGIESVRVSRSDGMGIGMLRAAGLPMLIISKETNNVVQARAEKLQIEALNGIEDKLGQLTKWCEAKRIPLDDVLYLGNDLNDAECLKSVGWPAVPADANPQVVHLAKIILKNKGGRGAVREVADLILKSLN
jgi:N-acylneuraminate cytidylyltransferase